MFIFEGPLMPAKVAVIQKPPFFLHRQETIESMLDSIDEAVAEGACWRRLKIDPLGVKIRSTPTDLQDIGSTGRL